MAMMKLMAPSIPREGKASKDRSSKPILKKKEVKVEINEDEANMLKYLGNLQQLLINI
jgi:hypothetical protein